VIILEEHNARISAQLKGARFLRQQKIVTLLVVRWMRLL
jgi:hypothetical protein